MASCDTDGRPLEAVTRGLADINPVEHSLAPAAHHPVRRRSTNLRSRERGVVALEYAVMLSGFLAVVGGIIVLSILFVTQALLDNAARDAARQIRIGTYTGSGYQGTLIADLCNHALTVGNFDLVHDCPNNLLVRIVSAPSGSPAGSGFAGLTAIDFSAGGTRQFDPLGPKDDVVLQIAYPFITFALPYTPTLMSTVAFQTEPY